MEGGAFFMKQIKIVTKETCPNLEQGVNKALESIEDDAPNIIYMLEQETIIIEFNAKQTRLMCVDCQFYDHTQGVAKAFGMCQCNGKRVRFSEHACDDFKDIRG